MVTRDKVCEILQHSHLRKYHSSGSIGWYNDGLGSGYLRDNVGASFVWFKTPSEIGPIQSLSVVFRVFNCSGFNQRWALCECLDENTWSDKYENHPEANRYLTTDHTVSDEKQIHTGTLYFEEIDTGSGDDSFSTVDKKLIIPTTELKPSTVYTFVCWPGGMGGTYELLQALNPQTGDMSVTYIPGLVYIDNGSSLDAYHCYIDNGTSWDLMIPYIDNGSGWDMYS